MKKLLFRLWQWTWGFPQSFLGAVLWLINRNQPHSQYHNCAVTYWENRGSLGVGMFLFIDKRHPPEDRAILAHEFGHSVQSAIIGPLFLPLIGLPSFLWCNLPFARKMRKENGISYFRFYTESSANVLGKWVTGDIPPTV